jgi:hypothetical protein
MKSLLNLVGSKHRPHGSDITPLLDDGTPLLLVRDPNNPHDPNAIGVYIAIGFIKASQAAQLAPKLDANCDATWDATIVRNGGSWIELEIEEPELDPIDQPFTAKET